jgi:hypothetical protein
MFAIAGNQMLINQLWSSYSHEMNICNKQVVEYHVTMEAIAQDVVLIPLGKEARVAYTRYQKP